MNIITEYGAQIVWMSLMITVQIVWSSLLNMEHNVYERQ